MPAWKWAAFLLRPLVTSLERGSREGVAKTSRGGDRWNVDFGGKGGERQGSRAEMTNYPKTEGGSSHLSDCRKGDVDQNRGCLRFP